MTETVIRIDISNSPELLRMVEEIEETGTERLLVRGDDELALVIPIREAAIHATENDRPQSRGQERVLNIIGRGRSKHPGDIAEHKDEYIADAVSRTEP